LIRALDAPPEEDVHVFLAFDEAHELSGRDEAQTRFSVVQSCLRILVKLAIFTIFLSTTGKVRGFIPPPAEAVSNRLQRGELKLHPPFTELGFDQMVDPKLDSSATIDKVSKIEYMVQFGRPL
jgi:hypothetical protein